MPLIASPRADRHFGSTISWNYGACWKSTKMARGDGRMCKYNIASYDKRNLPHQNRPEECSFSIYTDLASNYLRLNERASLLRGPKSAAVFACQRIIYEA